MSKEDTARKCCTGEVMAAFISRDLKDGEYGVIGAASQIPWVACRLAQATHAPGLWFGAFGFNNLKVDRLTWDLGRYHKHVGAENRMVFAEFMDMQGNPKFVDFAFYGGFQIDKYGNLNMAYIGDQKQPKFRGPGTVGLMATALLKRVYIFSASHSPRLFVEKVDFISGPGFIDGPGGREKAGCPPHSKGPRFVITPLAILDFDDGTKLMRLKSVHPGHTVDEVVGKMGFKPIVPAHVPETDPPTAQELAIMRAMDPDGILARIAP